MPVMNMFPGGSTLQIPLEACTAFSASAGNAKVELTWTDPKDKYATPEGDISDTGDQLVSEWDHTVLVRKTGSQPAGPNDGTVVVSSSVRNQYQSTAYVDSGLTNDTTYYYGVFAYNKDGVASAGAFVNATPIAGTPLSQLAEGTLIKILENGSPVEFYLAKHSYEPSLNGQGRELVVRKDCYNHQVWDDSNFNFWESSSILSWLNSSYKRLFNSKVQNYIGTTTYRFTNSGDSLVTTSDAFFLLSLTELGRSGYNSNIEGSTLPIASTLRIARFNGAATTQWTRTRNFGSHTYVYQLNESGNAVTSAANFPFACRPCFTLPSTALVDTDLNLIES